MNKLRAICILIQLAGLAGRASAQPTVTVGTSPGSPITYGTPVTIVANIFQDSGCPGQYVYFYDGVYPQGVLIAAAQAFQTMFNPTGCQAILSPNTYTSTFSVGTHSLTVNYYTSGGSYSETGATLDVTPAVTSTSLGTAPNPSTALAMVTLTATVTPAGATGTVYFRDEQTSATLGSASLSAGVATLGLTALPPGVDGLVAQYGGDSNHFGSFSAPVNQTVNQLVSMTFLINAPPTSTFGQIVDLGVNVTNSGLGGLVTFLDGTTTIGIAPLASMHLQTPALGVGRHSLTASYSGDIYSTPSVSTPVFQTVNPIVTTTSVQAVPTSTTAGQTVALTAAVSPPTASGTMTFLDGSTSIGSVPVVAGQAVLQTSTLAAGSHSLTASYSGDTNDTPSVSLAVTESVAQLTTTTALAAAPNPSVAGQNVALTAAVTPPGATGTVSFFDGASLLGVISLGNGIASLSISSLANGSHSLTASYSGDTNDAPSTSTALNQSVVAGASTTVTSLVPPTAAAGGAAFTLTVNGTQFSAGAVVEWNGAALATNFVSSTQVTGLVPANLIASPGAATVTVATLGGSAGGAPFIVNPPGQPCTFALTTSSAAFAASGGSGSIVVTASRTDCIWTGTTSASWISGFNTLTGSGTLVYTVAANTGATSRTGAVAIGAGTFKVIQGGTTCTYTLPFDSQAFGAAGGAGAAMVQAPPGCPWTAASSAPSVTVAAPGTGSGDGTVAYTVAPNGSAATLILALTIANQPYLVIQSGGASTPNCTATVPSVSQAALEGSTETLGDLLLNCTGLAGSPQADVTLTLNTNVTNTLTGNGNATDATLTVTAGTSPAGSSLADVASAVSVGAAQSGLIGGYNSLRWFGVPIVPAADGTATLRISNVRAAASLLATPGNLQPVPITGHVGISILSHTSASQSTLTAVPVAGALQTMANAVPTLLFTRGQSNPPAGGAQTLLPLAYREGAAAVFRANTTRLRAVLTNVPATVQVYAPVYPSEGAAQAQLYSADADGLGGSPLTGSPSAGGTYQLLTVTGGKATATWLVLAVDPAQAGTWTFPLLLVNAAAGDLDQIQASGSLGPVSGVTIASAVAPPLRYLDFAQPQSQVALRVVCLACQAKLGLTPGASLSPQLRDDTTVSTPTCGSNLITYSVVNDTTDPASTATNVKITANVSSGQSVVGCTASGGTSCSHSGQQVTVACETLAPGGTCSGTITTEPDPSLPGGTPLDNSVSASCDQPTLDPPAATSDSAFVLLAGSPVAVGGTPAAGGGAAESFTFQFSDPSGYQNLGVVNVLINNVLDGRNACYLAYIVPSSTLVLVDDGGDAGGPYAGSLVLGSSGTIQNSKCAVSLTSAVGNGTTLTLTLNIAFKPGFGGNRVTYVAARDQGTGNSNWQPLGVWQVPFTPAGTIAVTSVTPPRGAALSGTNQQFVLTLADSKGTGDFGVVDVLVNNFLDGRQACYLAYVASTGTLILVDDSGDAGGPYAGSMALNGGSGSIQNSQCTVSGAGSTVGSAPNTLTLTLNIAFKAAFAGNRVIYAAGRDSAGGNNTGWQALATFTVQ
ncbi:exported hypothetical protein [Candidatus Sulfopaludibacter sp. SbA4]|nr:exported hypothetical protein [Candidatus Sulfopaludibacter sp. SbA4]